MTQPGQTLTFNINIPANLSQFAGTPVYITVSLPLDSGTIIT